MHVTTATHTANFCDDDNELNSNIDIEPLKVPKHQVNEFIVREVTTKLMRAHSRAAIEEHLANAAKLVGDDVIPLKSLGYENPQQGMCKCISF